MYKLNIKRGKKAKYEAIVKQLFFGRLWLTVGCLECDTKKECKQYFRMVASY